jgi:glycosidase
VRSVARQLDDPDSLLSLYRDLVHLRNAHEALRVGDWTLVEANSARLYTFLRQTENETILVIINLNKNPVQGDNYSLALDGLLAGAVTAVSLYGLPPTSSPTDGGYIPFNEIPPHSTHIIQLIPNE